MLKSSFDKIIILKDDQKLNYSILVQIDQEQVVLTKFKGKIHTQLTSKIPGLMEKGSDLLQYDVSLEKSLIWFLTANNKEKKIFFFQCEIVTLYCEKKKEIPFEDQALNLLPDDGGIYVHAKNLSSGSAEVVFLNKTQGYSPSMFFKLEDDIKMIQRFGSGWFGAAGSGIYTLALKNNTFKKNIKIVETGSTEILNLVNTNHFLIVSIREKEENKTLVVMSSKQIIGKYVTYSLDSLRDSVIQEAYEWDEFLVFYGSKDIMLFKPPGEETFGLQEPVIHYGCLTLLNRTSFFASGKLLAAVPKDKNINDLNLLIFNDNIQTSFYLDALEIGSLNMKCDSRDETLIKSNYYVLVDLLDGKGKRRLINYTLNFTEDDTNLNPMLFLTIGFFVCGLIGLIVFTIWEWKKVKKMKLVYLREKRNRRGIYENKKIGFGRKFRASTYSPGGGLDRSGNLFPSSRSRRKTSLSLRADLTGNTDENSSNRQSKSSYLQMVESEKKKKKRRESTRRPLFEDDDDFDEIGLEDKYLNSDEIEEERKKREIMYIEYESDDYGYGERKKKGDKKNMSVGEKLEKRRRSGRLNLDVE